jgi:Carboxypeptidase regulatory-like domain
MEIWETRKLLKGIYAAFLLVLAASAFPVCTQTTSGRIVGSVTDGSGTALPNVTIRVTNVDTNAARTVVSDGAGGYSVTNLPIGNYEVSAERSGFKRYQQRPIKLDVDQTARIDVKMEVGELSESVTIQGTTPLIESERSAIGQVVENKTIVQIPLNGRNFIRLGSLIPGTTDGAPGNSNNRDRQGGVALTANGQRAEHNNFMLDGVDNNSTLNGTAVVIPSVDAIQEFKVQTSNYSAEFGRGAGAVVNIAIKSGTNQFHGSAYEFVRNDIFDASNTFAAISPTTGEREKNPLRRNQFGGTIGGPIELPGRLFGPLAYSGRNRTFFFFNYEGLRERRGKTVRGNVPTLAQRAGDFSGSPTIYDPFNVVNNARVAFANNRIPASRINPISQRLLDLMPLPNSADPAANYVTQLSDPANNNQYHIRGDHAITTNDLLSVRYSQTSSVSLNRAINFNDETTAIRTKGGTIGYTHIFSPTTINEFRFGTQRYGFEYTPAGFGEDFTTPLGLPTFGATGDFLRYPTIAIRNLSSFGGGSALPVLRAENNFQWIDTLSFILGPHSIKVGGDIRAYQLNNFQPQFSSGNYSFTGAFTGVRGSQYANGLADFLLGLPATETVLNTTGFDANRIRNTRSSLFIQDDYQVSSRLTLNLGLRWERDGAWTEKDNRWAYFDFSTGQLVYPSSAKMPFTTFPYPFRFEDMTDIKQPQNKMFAPRVGIAFRPFNNGSTVLRAAYGVFWGQPLGFLVLNAANTPPPYNLRQAATSGTTTPQLTFGVFPGVTPQTLIPTSPGGVFTLTPDEFINGYVQQWNFGVERELFRDVGVKLSYVGNKGTHLERRYEGNPALPLAAGAINSRRLYPAFQGITFQNSQSYSSYHSLQVSAEKRFSRGLLFLAGYTWSKSLDDSSSWSGLGGQESQFAQDPSRIYLEKARSGSDLRHRFTFTFVYELPFRSESSRTLNALISGWQTSGIITARTGYPFTVTVGGDIPNAGTGNTRANLVGDPEARACPNELNCWFNTAAFTQPNPFTFGTAGRNILSGPGALGVDFSAMRVFKLTEGHQFQFRAEFFNFLNHPVYGLPNATVGNNAFGTIRSGSNREMQFALKYIF